MKMPLHLHTKSRERSKAICRANGVAPVTRAQVERWRALRRLAIRANPFPLTRWPVSRD